VMDLSKDQLLLVKSLPVFFPTPLELSIAGLSIQNL
jgi:hypothetical protein